jgi:hypothetical protein
MTSQDYKATRELWAHIESCADNPQDIATLLLELRSRVEALEEAENDRRFETAKALIDKPAPATLAQPEPVAPTDEELLAVAASTIEPYERSGIAVGEYEPEYECAVEAYGSELIAFARAVLERYGNNTSEENLDG